MLYRRRALLDCNLDYGHPRILGCVECGNSSNGYRQTGLGYRRTRDVFGTNDRKCERTATRDTLFAFGRSASSAAANSQNGEFPADEPFEPGLRRAHGFDLLHECA